MLFSAMEHLNLQPQRPPLKSGFAFQLCWKRKVNGCQFLETFYTCRGSDTALFLRFHGDSAARCTAASICECTAATFQAEECAHTRMCALLRWCFLVCVCFCSPTAKPSMHAPRARHKNQCAPFESRASRYQPFLIQHL